MKPKEAIPKEQQDKHIKFRSGGVRYIVEWREFIKFSRRGIPQFRGVAHVYDPKKHGKDWKPYV